MAAWRSSVSRSSSTIRPSSWQQRFAVQAPNAYARAHKYTLDAVAVWILTYNPTDMHAMSRWLPSVRTPIADVCHVYEKDEFSSVRGTPEIAPAVMRAINAMRFENATLTRMIATTLNPYWAEPTDRTLTGAKMPGEEALDDWVSQMLVEPGAFNVLPYGVKVTQAQAPDAGRHVRAVHEA